MSDRCCVRGCRKRVYEDVEVQDGDGEGIPAVYAGYCKEHFGEEVADEDEMPRTRTRTAAVPVQSENRWRDSTIIPYARLKGWRVAFVHDSRHSPSGWPDLVLVRGWHMLIRELKTERGIVTEAQQGWLDALERAGVDAKVWRPSDWGDIQKELE